MTYKYEILALNRPHQDVGKTVAPVISFLVHIAN